MIHFTNRTPTIAQIYQYTYSNKHTYSRFLNCDRDILKTSIKIENRFVYQKNDKSWKKAEEKLQITATSAPNYYPYNKVKSKHAKKQRKIKHQYDVVILISKTEDGSYDFWSSRIIWRTGSLKSPPKHIAQKYVKQIHKETREKLERKYRKYPPTKRKELIQSEISKIKRNAPFLTDGDYIAQEFGIFLDGLYRDQFIQKKFDCLWGKPQWYEPCQWIEYPFFDKIMIGCINFLLRKGIIKYK